MDTRGARPDRLPDPARRAGEVVLQAVDTAVTKRWDRAVLVATEVAGPVEDRVARIVRTYVREMSAVGAVAGAAAAVPGAGAITLVGTAAIELGWFATRTGDLILAVAAAHGHTGATVEERRAWVLSVLAFGEAAPSGFTRVAGELRGSGGERPSGFRPRHCERSTGRWGGRS